LIFVSHCADDARATRRMAFELIRLGIPVWLDEDQLGAGVRVFDSIRSGIENSQAVLFVISPQAIGSKYVNDEIAWAAKRGKTVVAVLLPNATEVMIPDSLREFKVFKASGASDFVRIAHAICQFYSFIPVSPAQRQLWIRDPFDSFSGSGSPDFSFSAGSEQSGSVVSVRLFDNSFGDLMERAFSASVTDLTLLVGVADYDFESTRLRDLPKIVSSVADYIGAAATLFHKSAQGSFEQRYFSSLLLVLMRNVRLGLEVAENYSSPSSEEAAHVTKRREAWSTASPFDGGLRIDVSVCGADMGATNAPKYVQQIDLAPHMVPGQAVLFEHDLGTVAGWVTGRKIWTSLKSGLPIEVRWPSVEQVFVGPA